MSPIKGIEFQIDWLRWSIGFGICIKDYPSLFWIELGPIVFVINRAQYWKNGII